MIDDVDKFGTALGSLYFNKDVNNSNSVNREARASLSQSLLEVGLAKLDS